MVLILRARVANYSHLFVCDYSLYPLNSLQNKCIQSILYLRKIVKNYFWTVLNGLLPQNNLLAKVFFFNIILFL
jgi:hypothetical protein